MKFKILGTFLFIAFFASTITAENLCDLNCSLSISFPAGGSITAVEPLVITFGDGGLVDTAGSVTAYLDGETLALNTNESLAFESGGRFEIGTNGNIDYSNLAITTGGVMSLSAVAAPEQIQIPNDGKLSLSGGGTFIFLSSLRIWGSLKTDGDVQVNVPGSDSPSGCGITSSSGLTISATASNGFVIDNNQSCNSTYTNLINSPVVTGGILSVSDTLTNTVVGTGTLVFSIPGKNDGTEIVSSTETQAAENDGESAGFFGLYMLMFLIFMWPLNYLRASASPDRT